MQDAVVAGNGAPPQYGMALAALDGRLLVERTEEFGRVWRDDATGELRLAARGERVNHYPDEPLIEYRWRVGRRGSEIVMERDLLTPWIVALDEYCSGKRPGRGRGRGVADACGSHLDSVARLSSTSIAVRFETGRVFTLAAADGTWDVVRVR